jgi:BASS family bile acid:Na+ symporter
MTMTDVILILLKTSIVLSVFAIGLKATFADATFMLRRPTQLGRAFLSMNVLMPLVALAVGAPFDLHPAVKIALVVIAVSPTPPVFPKQALKAGGTEAYAIGLLVAAAIVSVVIIPLSMAMIHHVTGISLAMRPGAVAVLVLSTVLAPLVAGIVVRHVWSAVAHRAAGPVAVLGSGLLIASAVPIVIGLANTVFSFVTDGTILGLGGFALAGLFIGHLLGGPEPADRPVLALATASRHPAVAMAIAHTNFPDQRLAGVAVFLYVVLTALMCGLYLSWVRRTSAPRSTTIQPGTPR